MGGEAAPAPTTYAPSPAAPAPTYGQAPASGPLKTTSQCDAEYAANKAAIKASWQTKRAFVAACRAGNETIPQGTAAAPAPAPAPAPTGGPLVPWLQRAAPAPAPAPVPAPANCGSAPTPTAAGEFASELQARGPSDTVAMLLATSVCGDSPNISARRLLSSWKDQDPSSLSDLMFSCRVRY